VEASSDTHATLRVADLAASVQRALRNVPSGWVEGEVQKLRRPGSGHVYFTLADRDAAIECVVWRSRVGRIAEWPSEGRLVQAHFDRVDFYARHGRVSLHVDAVRLTGEGELLARRAGVLARLRADGLTAAARRPLPAFPRRVGVISARNSDAKMDVIKALRDRWPSVHIMHRPALVEGVAAVDLLIDALAHLQSIPAVDVIVLARGGGGVAELTAFDDERLCRAIFASPVPVVTSIGHTPQRPNCDHVAAAYADVPARAAELVVASATEVRTSIEHAGNALAAIPESLRSHAHQLAATGERARPRQRLGRRELEMQGLDGRLQQAARRLYTGRQHGLDDTRHRLARARSAVPAPSTLDLAAQRLHLASIRFLTSWRVHIDASRRDLTTTLARVPATEEIGRLQARLAPAAARAHRRITDYERALTRRHEEANRSFTRRLREHTREMAEIAASLTATVRRRTVEGRRILEHIVEVIAARDFRRSGWVLAGDATGQPVRSARCLTPGEVLSLQFHDGRVNSTVTSVDPEPGGANA
jgi:exodeoxyribonuclease VII large subunit